MSELKKKGSDSGFESGVDFDVLKGNAPVKTGSFESGFEPASTQSQAVEATPAEPAIQAAPVEEEAKKRYYSPTEVMKKKGCIGCGGMVLALPLILSAIGLAIAVF